MFFSPLGWGEREAVLKVTVKIGGGSKADGCGDVFNGAGGVAQHLCADAATQTVEIGVRRLTVNAGEAPAKLALAQMAQRGKRLIGERLPIMQCHMICGKGDRVARGVVDGVGCFCVICGHRHQKLQCLQTAERIVLFSRTFQHTPQERGLCGCVALSKQEWRRMRGEQARGGKSFDLKALLQKILPKIEKRTDARLLADDLRIMVDGGRNEEGVSRREGDHTVTKQKDAAA